MVMAMDTALMRGAITNILLNSDFGAGTSIPHRNFPRYVLRQNVHIFPYSDERFDLEPLWIFGEFLINLRYKVAFKRQLLLFGIGV